MPSFRFHDATLAAALLAAMAPFAAFLTILLFTRERPRASAVVSISAIAAAFLSSMFLIAYHWGMVQPIRYAVRWLATGELQIPFGFLLDPVSLLMLLIVAAISLLVQIYSIGYMAGDPGYARYYAFLSLFAWAMISLTLAPSLLQLYIFWELVGLSSYLLIGFWYEKFSASTAGKKAFVMTRLGDIAFFIGLLLLLVYGGSLEILAVNAPTTAGIIPESILPIIILLVFGGIVGKSAQFPLLTWLPDAMEGPTPVSALLHSATMVAAGVFLLARLFPFFSFSPDAMTVILAIGTISMLLSATMAVVSRDIKQVWAYSTISQLGYMIMGLAAGGYFAGVFHLTTHAAFKALLFLCSGVLIHRYHSNDMFELGGKGRGGMKIVLLCMTIGAAALAGIPPLSGFFSKERILWDLSLLPSPGWLIAGMTGVFLTAYYAFRLIFVLVLPGIPRGGTGKEGGHESHSRSMLWPLAILAAATVLLGFAQGPLETFLEGVRGFPKATHPAHPPWLLPVSLGLALAGIGLAWVEFGRKGAGRVGIFERIRPLHLLFAERWYIDRFYRFFLDYAVYKGITRLFTRNEHRVIDGGIAALCRGTLESGGIVSRLHAGMVQYRLLAAFAVIVLLGLFFFV